MTVKLGNTEDYNRFAVQNIDDVQFTTWDERNEFISGLANLIGKGPRVLGYTNKNVERKVNLITTCINNPDRVAVNGQEFKSIMVAKIAVKVNEFKNHKLIAGYSELGNEYLDKYIFKCPADFDKYKVALEILLNKNEIVESDDLELQGRISSIKELIDNPDWYANEPEQQELFQKTILKRVAEKINELDSLSSADKQKYIELMNKDKEETEKNQQKMKIARLPQPGSEGRTITEEEQHREWQNELNRGANPQNLFAQLLHNFHNFNIVQAGLAGINQNQVNRNAPNIQPVQDVIPNQYQARENRDNVMIQFLRMLQRIRQTPVEQRTQEMRDELEQLRQQLRASRDDIIDEVHAPLNVHQEFNYPGPQNGEGNGYVQIVGNFYRGNQVRIFSVQHGLPPQVIQGSNSGIELEQEIEREVEVQQEVQVEVDREIELLDGQQQQGEAVISEEALREMLNTIDRMPVMVQQEGQGEASAEDLRAMLNRVMLRGPMRTFEQLRQGVAPNQNQPTQEFLRVFRIIGIPREERTQEQRDELEQYLQFHRLRQRLRAQQPVLIDEVHVPLNVQQEINYPAPQNREGNEDSDDELNQI